MHPSGAHSSTASAMAPSECNKTLRVPSVYSASISTNLTSSTSDLNSATYSPRALYAQTFDRPYSSESAPAAGSARRRNRKNIRDMTGSFDFLTTEDEFEQLPIAVRRKVRRRRWLLCLSLISSASNYCASASKSRISFQCYALN